MAYVAVKGGRQAIENACDLLSYQLQKGTSKPLGLDQIEEQLYLGIDRIMSEAGLYAPKLAALALKQAAGDSFEASFMLRAYRATKSRLSHSQPLAMDKMRVIRRISAAFKEIPGGQILGPTSDYTLRLLDFDLLEDSESRRQAFREKLLSHLDPEVELPDSFPKVVEILRRDGLLVEKSTMEKESKPFDITRQSLTYPASRSATLQSLSRGETGGMLTLAYSSMRGYGNVHPFIGELRVGYVPLVVAHPETGEPYTVGEVKVTEAEAVAQYHDGTEDGPAKFTLGYGLCFGQNELKAISMAILDRTMRNEEGKSPVEDQEFVLSHIDGIEAMGFCNHWKLPHYVDFQSSLDRLRRTQKVGEPQESEL
ncbi:alpha-D-ribose 1-methylphosphonate 5-triphosphate synthase subunit PhnI [Desulfuromusa kysingii]|uniref:Alpha-D-ribose 1-methylphosphonate 5-triphosphate synthase subunit PhnI n=1 Tax=Desulfuromusa kysingii TaxID=37625 RepID=A0A1H3ZXF6_9BACT|nr:carbon-phosphorus lyase complex subunit PhnI [Desulfuromusa kysingii]SEA28121.1 alpha-D-ribose 1-methylphosphonate 5-triphosphate synthase subunit PhnI [Desulfuromusa kysingii]